jgi:hypothetical protein|tara:strand:+ start:189 stop:611 length:423 start_codon:yes stop_codon:yes gene_type:complete
MAISRISGNQISTTTEAILTTLSFLNANSVFKLPSGTTAQRPVGVVAGTLRYNSEIDNAEIYVNDIGDGTAGWAPVAGGGPSIGDESIIRTNGPTISENLTIGPTANNDPKYTNGFTCGPVTIQSGYTVTIESNAAWSVI